MDDGEEEVAEDEEDQVVVVTSSDAENNMTMGATADTAGQSEMSAEQATAAARSTEGDNIDVKNFGELVLPRAQMEEALSAWKLFLAAAVTEEAAGEAIYSALSDTFFVSKTEPRAVGAMRLLNSFSSFIFALEEPPKLKTLVETLGFGFLHLDVTIPRVQAVRDAVLDLLMVELAERFTRTAQDGWRALLNYLGGAIIYVKSHYAERINVLLGSKNRKCRQQEE